MCLEDPALAHLLLDKLADSLCAYASHQVRCVYCYLGIINITHTIVHVIFFICAQYQNVYRLLFHVYVINIYTGAMRRANYSNIRKLGTSLIRRPVYSLCQGIA